MTRDAESTRESVLTSARADSFFFYKTVSGYNGIWILVTPAMLENRNKEFF